MKRDYATKYVEMYEEAWQRDHEETQRCFDLEEVILLGIATYDFIIGTDENWRRAVYRGERE